MSHFSYGPSGAAPAPAPAPAAPAKKKSGTGALFLIGVVSGLVMLLYVVNSTVFRHILTSGDLMSLYQNDKTAHDLLEMGYTLFCVGLPALVVWAILKLIRRGSFSIPLSAPRGGNVLLLVFGGLGVCLCGSLLSNLVISWAGNAGLGFYSYDAAIEGEELPGSAFGMVLMVLHSAVAPALIEEFTFRGVLLQPLRRYGDWFAICTSAVLFGLMHATVTQVPFAIIAGIALGYVTVVSGSLWTGFLVHLLNNLLAVGYSVILGLYGEQTALIFSNVSMFGMLGVGAIALVVYAVRKPRFLRLRPSAEPNAVRVIYYLSPTLLLAAVELLMYTAKDIYKL